MERRVSGGCDTKGDFAGSSPSGRRHQTPECRPQIPRARNASRAREATNLEIWQRAQRAIWQRGQRPSDLAGPSGPALSWRRESNLLRATFHNGNAAHGGKRSRADGKETPPQHTHRVNDAGFDPESGIETETSWRRESNLLRATFHNGNAAHGGKRSRADGKETPPQHTNRVNDAGFDPESGIETETSWRRESNPRPAAYKAAALPTELRQRGP